MPPRFLSHLGVGKGHGRKLSERFRGDKKGDAGVGSSAATSSASLVMPSNANNAEPEPSGNAPTLSPSTVPQDKQAVDGTPPLATVSEPPARDLWCEAFKQLPSNMQQKLNLVANISLQENIDELLEITKQRQEECEKKFWRFKAGNHEIVLRDYASKIVSTLMSVGDIAIQFAPPQASLAWSAVKVVMQTPVIESAQMCALLASTDRIVRIIKRGQVYELVYKIENTPKVALENLQSALVELYSATLKLLANSKDLLSKNTAARTVYAILNPGETADHFAELKDLETRLDTEALPCESGRSDTADRRVLDLLHGLDAPLTRVDENVSMLLAKVNSKEQLEILEWISSIPYGKHHNTVKEARTAETCGWLLKNEKLQEWGDTSSSAILWLQGFRRVPVSIAKQSLHTLFPPSEPSTLLSATRLSLRVIGAFEVSATSLVILGSGAGKTFLTSMVIDHVKTLLKGSPNDEGFAFFYCNRNEEVRREPLAIFRSYVRQLSTSAGNPGDVQKKLRDIYEKSQREGSDLSFEMCKQQILDSINLYPKTTLVLDALDECESTSRGRFIEAIEFLLSESKRPLKIFISSRPDGDIRDRFLSLPNIEIQAAHNQDDIEKFVRQEIVRHPRWNKMSKSLRDEVSRTLLERSDGMFQWASLQISQILELRIEPAIRDRLGKLPADLEKAYEEIYSQIAARNEHERVLAERAFIWVMGSCIPLTSSELLGAIRLDVDSDIFHLQDEIDEDILLDLCKNLLVIDTQRHVWRLSHLSVAEYFEKNHWNFQKADLYVGKACLLFLVEDYKTETEGDNLRHTEGTILPQQETADRERRDEESRVWIDNDRYEESDEDLDLNASYESRTILEYAQYYWANHVQNQERSGPNARFCRRLKTFLGSPMQSSAHYQRWYFVVYTSGQDRRRRRRTNCSIASLQSSYLRPTSAAILAMCQFSVYTLLFDWWATAEIDIALTDKYGNSLLKIAASKGATSICRNLIQRGLPADPPPLNNYPWVTPLIAAAMENQLETVLFFVKEENVDVNMPLEHGRYGSALVAAAAAAAADYGNFDNFRFLVSEGQADVNMQLTSGKYGCALEAALEGDTEIVNYLLEAGAYKPSS